MSHDASQSRDLDLIRARVLADRIEQLDAAVLLQRAATDSTADLPGIGVGCASELRELSVYLTNVGHPGAADEVLRLADLVAAPAG